MTAAVSRPMPLPGQAASCVETVECFEQDCCNFRKERSDNEARRQSDGTRLQAIDRYSVAF